MKKIKAQVIDVHCTNVKFIQYMYQITYMYIVQLDTPVIMLLINY